MSCGLCSVLNSLLTPIFLVGCSHVWWFFVLLGWILGCSTDFFQGNRAASGKYECHVVTEGDKGPCCPQGRAEGRQCPLEKRASAERSLRLSASSCLSATNFLSPLRKGGGLQRRLCHTACCVHIKLKAEIFSRLVLGWENVPGDPRSPPARRSC